MFQCTMATAQLGGAACFLLSKFLNWFVYPLSLLFLGLLVILVFYRRRYARWGLAFVLLLLYGMSTMVTVKPLMRWLEGPRPTSELHQHYDVAIVLTGMVALRRSRPGHLEFNEHVERILEGISLVKRGIADKLLIAGGSGVHSTAASVRPGSSARLPWNLGYVTNKY